MKRIRISTGHIIPLSFLLAIAVGTLFLMLPFSSASGISAGFLTSLFTATTSICVTGLVVVDTYSQWSLFGQFIILVLIQIGGLGIVSVGSMIMLISRKKFYLSSRLLLGDSLNIDRKKGILLFLTNMFKGVFIIEFCGTILCSFKFIPVFGFEKGLWTSLFQSVSAFCNAGMDIAGPASMIDYRDSYLLMITTMCLIILGGIGFVVWFDIIDAIRNGIKNRYSPAKFFLRLPEHTKIVIIVTVFLIISGALIIFAAEYDNPETLGNMGMADRIINSLFQSVTCRTAGFASVPQEKMSEISCIICYILMFVGGSPVGTAGGIKTMTAFLFFMNAVSYINGKKENVVFHKRVPEEIMRKASAIVFFSLLTVFVMTLLLMSVFTVSFTDALFEVTSALGTVGLTRAITPTLNTAGRVIIIISMYLGRVGPISMAIFFSKGSGLDNSIKHADGKFIVG